MSASSTQTIVGTTTSVYYDSTAKLIWDIEGFDLAAAAQKNMTSDPLKVECKTLGRTLEWEIQLLFATESNLDISLLLRTPREEVTVDCSYDISVGKTGLDCITQSAQECYCARRIFPQSFGRVSCKSYMSVNPPKTMLRFSLDNVVKQRTKLYPQGTLRITVDLRMCLKLANRQGVHGYYPTLVDPTNQHNTLVASPGRTRKYSDITIKCQTREFGVHKFVLGQSSVFAAMFAAGMKEAQSNEIEISDVDPEVFELFLKSLYGESFEVPTDHKDLLELINCAEKYDVKCLKNRCLQCMPPMITLENAGELTIAARRYCEDEEFRKFFRNYCQKWHSTLLKNPGYKQLYVANLDAFI